MDGNLAWVYTLADTWSHSPQPTDLLAECSTAKLQFLTTGENVLINTVNHQSAPKYLQFLIPQEISPPRSTVVYANVYVQFRYDISPQYIHNEC